MDEKDQENQNLELDLEDILKEFSQEKDPAEEAEEVSVWDGSPSKAPVARDTIRLDEVTKELKAKEQQEALEKNAPKEDATEVATEQEAPEEAPSEKAEVAEEPPEEEAPPEAAPAEETPAPEEAFAEGWEPEYEQPFAEYVPQEPLVFRPRSRLQELKKKLVAGPERRYYELTEIGVGKVQFAAFLNLLVALLSTLVTVLYSSGSIGAGRMRFVIFTQVLSLLLSAILGSYQLIAGFSDLLKRRFSLNSLLIFSLLACLTDGVLCLQELRIPCCAAFSLTMTLALWGEAQKRNTQIGQMDTMRKAVRLDSVVAVPDYMDGKAGFLRAEGQVEDFMDNCDAPSKPEKVLSIYALTALLVSGAVGLVAGIRGGVSSGLRFFSACLLVAVPSSSYIANSRPMAILEHRLHKLGIVFCGWESVRELSRPGVFPLSDTDLFPLGTTKLNGLKFYGSRSTDEIVAFSAALICAGGGGLAPLFQQLLDSRGGYHYDVENFTTYDGGIGAEVEGEAVLAGSLSFLQNMGVDMPEGTRVNQAVYVAVDGQLCAVYAMAYGKVKATAHALTTLCGYRKLTPVIMAEDFMLTEDFLHAKFGINTRRLAFPDRAARHAMAAHEPPEGAKSLALTTGTEISGPAFAVTGARALRSASLAGTVLSMLGGILGILMMLALAIVKADYLLTPVSILLYELIWLVPGLLVSEWTRSV